MVLAERISSLSDKKVTSLDDMVTVVRINGGLFLKPKNVVTAEPPCFVLSPRETQILSHVANGNSNKEIAGHFGISDNTVKNHLTSIMQKLHARDRTHAVVIALRHGWISV